MGFGRNIIGSYDAILAGIEETYTHYGLGLLTGHSCLYLAAFCSEIRWRKSTEKGLDAEEMNRFRGQSLQEKNAHSAHGWC